MTKLIDWSRFYEMDSRERSGINTASTFSEQRQKEERLKKEESDFGLSKMENEVNIEWPDEKAEKSFKGEPDEKTEQSDPKTSTRLSSIDIKKKIDESVANAEKMQKESEAEENEVREMKTRAGYRVV